MHRQRQVLRIERMTSRGMVDGRRITENGTILPDVMNRVVAFVDILGFQNLVDEAFDRDKDLLVSLNQTLESVVKFTAITRTGALDMRELSPYLQATAFSDSLSSQITSMG